MMGIAGLFTSTLLAAACLQPDQDVDPGVSVVESAATATEFATWQGEITQSSSETFEAGTPSSLLLHGPDAAGRYAGEWRQLGCGHVNVIGREMSNGNLRLVGTDLEAVCREVASGALQCLLQLADGTAEAELDDGNSGDPDNPDCVSCADERAAGCCDWVGCCVRCAPVGECDPGGGGVGGDLGTCGPDWPND